MNWLAFLSQTIPLILKSVVDVQQILGSHPGVVRKAAVMAIIDPPLEHLDAVSSKVDGLVKVLKITGAEGFRPLDNTVEAKK